MWSNWLLNVQVLSIVANDYSSDFSDRCKVPQSTATNRVKQRKWSEYLVERRSPVKKTWVRKVEGSNPGAGKGFFSLSKSIWMMILLWNKTSYNGKHVLIVARDVPQIQTSILKVHLFVPSPCFHGWFHIRGYLNPFYFFICLKSIVSLTMMRHFHSCKSL